MAFMFNDDKSKEIMHVPITKSGSTSALSAGLTLTASELGLDDLLRWRVVSQSYFNSGSANEFENVNPTWRYSNNDTIIVDVDPQKGDNVRVVFMYCKSVVNV